MNTECEPPTVRDDRPFAFGHLPNVRNAFSTCHLVGLLPPFVVEVQTAVDALGRQSVVHDDVDSFLQAINVSQAGCVVAALRDDDERLWALPDRLAAKSSILKVVFLADSTQARAAVEALRHHAHDVVLWPIEAVNLQPAIEKAIAASLLEQNAIQRSLAAQEKLARLTPSEYEVMELVLSGLANKNIASRLNIAERTVEVRRKCIFDKLETRNTVEIYALVQEAQQRKSSP